MYKSIEITNYRCFDHLKVKDLARVNIICGANNSGKTALLEAIYLHAAEGDLSAIADVLRQRGHSPRASDVAGEPVWSTLFAGLESEAGCRVEAEREGRRGWAQQLPLPIGEEDEDALSLAPGRSQLRMRQLRDPHEFKRYLQFRAMGPSPAYHRTDELLGAVLGLEWREGQLRTGRNYVAEGDLARLRAVRRERSIRDVAFVPARAPSVEPDSARFEEVALAKQTPEIVQVLNTIEPRLRDLRSVPRSTAIYGEIGLPRLVSVRDMGEGMQRLLSLALALWNAGGGVVLVDEIENGLHHSVLKDVWRLIGEAARRFDVQVFAATHSWECIVAAHRAFREAFPDDLRVHRIEHLNGKVRDVVYGDEEVEAAIEIGAEVR